MIQTGEIFGNYGNYAYINSVLNIKINEDVTLQLGSQLNHLELKKSYHQLKKYFSKEFAVVIDKKSTQKLNKNSTKCIMSVKKSHCKVSVIIQLQDGRLVSCGENKQIRVWDSTLFQCNTVIKTDNNRIVSLLQLQDGRLVSGTNNTIIVWNIITFKSLISFKAHLGEVISLIQLEDGRIASYGADVMLKFWNISTFECLKSLKPHQTNFFRFIQLLDGRIVSVGSFGFFKIWDTNTLECLQIYNSSSRYCQLLIQLLDGLLAFCCEAMIRILDLSIFECPIIIIFPFQQKLYFVPFCSWKMEDLFHMINVRMSNYGILKHFN